MKGLPVDERRYYRGTEADQFSFVRLPKVLFTDPRYKFLSLDAKVIYSAMLDRMSLSIQKGWYDDSGRIFIYFMLESVCNYLNCSKGKGCKVLAELENEGMIYRVKQGLNRPDKIFVLRIEYMPKVSQEYKNTTVVLSDDELGKMSADVEESGGAKTERPEFQKSEVRKCKNRNSGISKSECLEFQLCATPEFQKTDPNNTEYKQTEEDNTESINPSIRNLSVFDMIDGVMDGKARIDENRFMELLNDTCSLSFWTQYYERREKELEEMLDGNMITTREYENEHVDPGYVMAMARCIVKLLLGDSRKPVVIKSEPLDRRSVLKHLCRHTGRQFGEAYNTAKRSTRSTNVAAYAVSTLYSMEETA